MAWLFLPCSAVPVLLEQHIISGTIITVIHMECTVPLLDGVRLLIHIHSECCKRVRLSKSLVMFGQTYFNVPQFDMSTDM